MRRVWVVLIAVAALAASVSTYWVATRPPNSGGCPPRPLVGFGSITTSVRGGTYWQNASIAQVGVGFPVSRLSVYVTLAGTSLVNGTPAGSVERILLVNATGALLAVEAPATRTWTQGEATLVNTTQSLDVVSSAALTGDNLVAMYHDSCGTGGMTAAGIP